MTDGQSLTIFGDIKVIGELPPRQVASKLRQMGDPDTASEISQHIATTHKAEPLFGWGPPKPWQHTTHQFGYIAKRVSDSTDPLPIQYAGAIAADPSLKNNRIDIKIDRLRVYDYPGRGGHNILLSFAARNQSSTVPGNAPELVSFSQTYRVQEGELAGVAGYPVFNGLNVGSQGAALECATINVSNDADEAVLAALESPPFKDGLRLLDTLQPALAPFTQITLGVVKTLTARNRNVGVQKFYLGLDFTPAALGIRLAEGNYIAVQVPSETTLNWDDWVLSRDGAIVNKANNMASIPYNYVVFRITRSEK